MAAAKSPKKLAAKQPAVRKTTKKPAASGVFDIAKPGSGSLQPNGTSRPVIIKHQVMQDPMVVAGGDAEPAAEPTTAPTLPKTRKVVIQPLHGDIKAEPIAATPADVKTDSEDIPPADEPADQAGVADQPANAEPQLRTSVILQPPTPDQPIATPQPKPKPVPDPAAAVAPAETLLPNVPIGELAPEPDTTAIPDDNQSRQAEAEAARAKAARLQKMIDEEEYFLPIETLEERRSRKVALIGLLLIILLAATWYDSALDAGLLPNSFNLPHTHLFTGK